ncbi:MAG: hypothetical protein HPY57_16100 [Ignavibacteria bacterium]|nr:hypothetical protein [Ignavibacteria bacterium]
MAKEMKFIMTYETYVSMNYPDLYNEPVPDYIDTNYYMFYVEEDEKKPPKKTGYDDRETKNTKKKSVYVISPT